MKALNPNRAHREHHKGYCALRGFGVDQGTRQFSNEVGCDDKLYLEN
jgi:hypothetical protein